MEVYRYPSRHAKAWCSWTRRATPRCRPPGQIAGGAKLIAFTTGRGSMFGAKPVPSIKLANTRPMFRRLEEDMDNHCGEVLDGTASSTRWAAASST